MDGPGSHQLNVAAKLSGYTLSNCDATREERDKIRLVLEQYGEGGPATERREVVLEEDVVSLATTGATGVALADWKTRLLPKSRRPIVAVVVMSADLDADVAAVAPCLLCDRLPACYLLLSIRADKSVPLAGSQCLRLWSQSQSGQSTSTQQLDRAIMIPLCVSKSIYVSTGNR